MKWSRVLFFVLAAAFIVFLIRPAWSSGDCKGQSCNSGGGTTEVDTNVAVDTSIVSGDTSISHSSRALALSNVLGDVDIAGCLGSTQWATPLFSKQKLTVNWPCMAEFYLEHGKTELAAMAICNTEIRKEFSTEEECREAHDFEPIIEAAVVVFEESADEDEELHEEQQMLYEDLQAKVRNLEQRLNRPRTVVEQRGGLSEEQKAALRGVVE